MTDKEIDGFFKQEFTMKNLEFKESNAVVSDKENLNYILATDTNRGGKFMTRCDYPDCFITVNKLEALTENEAVVFNVAISIRPPGMHDQLEFTIRVKAEEVDRFYQAFMRLRPFRAHYAFETLGEKFNGETVFTHKFFLDNKFYQHVQDKNQCRSCGGKVFHFVFCPKFTQGEKIV